MKYEGKKSSISSSVCLLGFGEEERVQQSTVMRYVLHVFRMIKEDVGCILYSLNFHSKICSFLFEIPV